MKRLNWGVMIAIFYSTFVVVLVAFVIYSTTVKYDLVADDYYDQEINYQQQIDKIKRAKTFEEPLSVENLPNMLMLQYPNEVEHNRLNGELHFYRPSDKNLDFKVKVSADSNNRQFVQTQKMKSGLWKLKANWAEGDSTYYNEFVLVLD
jgi:hypothetical protein